MKILLVINVFLLNNTLYLQNISKLTILKLCFKIFVLKPSLVEELSSFLTNILHRPAQFLKSILDHLLVCCHWKAVVHERLPQGLLGGLQIIEVENLYRRSKYILILTLRSCVE